MGMGVRMGVRGGEGEGRIVRVFVRFLMELSFLLFESVNEKVERFDCSLRR